MDSIMMRYSVVGKWSGAAVGAEKGKLIGDYKVLGVLGSPVLFVSDWTCRGFVPLL